MDLSARREVSSAKTWHAWLRFSGVLCAVGFFLVAKFRNCCGFCGMDKTWESAEKPNPVFRGIIPPTAVGGPPAFSSRGTSK